MSRLTLFGLFAVTAMLACYAFENRSRWFILGFSAACVLGSIVASAVEPGGLTRVVRLEMPEKFGLAVVIPNYALPTRESRAVLPECYSRADTIFNIQRAALLIAALATGSSHGFIYVRAEYPLAHRRLQNAIDLARSRELLEGFDIELRIGAGAYVCGEETALFQSIEGFRGEPRNKPPFPVEVGLFGKPTAENNVETLFNVLDIVADGGEAYTGIGTKDSTGTRLFCVSGAVARPGLYELPFGATLRELLDLAEAEPPKAVLLGGAAGAFVGPDLLDLRLTYEDTREAGVTLGSGVVIVYDEGADLVGALLRIAEFFRDESCGQCVPCRVGTVRQEEALHRLAAGRAHEDELQTLAELAQVMRDASICGLGQTAASAVMSAIGNLKVFTP